MTHNNLNSKRCRLASISAALAVTAVTLSAWSTTGDAHSLAQGGQMNKELLGNASGLSHPTSSAQMVDGVGLIDRWYNAADALQAYSFTYQMTVYKGGSEKSEKGNLFFKKPRLMRIEVTGGPKAGSVAVLEKDGKVHGHMGGALKFFSATISPNSDMLHSLNGWPMVDSDYFSLAVAIKQYIKDGCIAKASENPVADGQANSERKLYVFELTKPSGELYKRATFDPQTLQPVEWWDYTNGKLYAHSTWTNFKPGAQISDKTFTTKGDK